MLTLVLGGSRSGKSGVAEGIAGRAGGPVRYVATAVATDPELAERIAVHRARRPATWETIEVSDDLGPALAGFTSGTLLVDSLTVWLGTLLLAAGEDPAADAVAAVRARALGQLDELIGWASRPGCAAVVVSDEVGSGVVPAYRLGRLYRDLLGDVNQSVARRADPVLLVVAGIPVDLQANRWRP